MFPHGPRAPVRLAALLALPALLTFLALMAVMALQACDLTGAAPAPRQYLSLKVSDSLRNYSALHIVLISVSPRDTLETLWDGPLTDAASLRKLPTEKYAGGSVDIYVEGRQGWDIPYRILVEYRGSADNPKVVALPAILLPDTLPPVLVKLGKDTVLSEKGAPYVESGITCTDAKDGKIVPVASGALDIGTLGNYPLTYSCHDKAGNAAAAVIRVVTIIPVVDRVAPTVVLTGPDFVGILLGKAYTDGGAHCEDDKDRNLPVQQSGSVNTSVAGNYKILFSCTDLSGNRSPQIFRTVQVADAADSTNPSLIFKSGKLFEVGLGTAFVEPVVVCIDANDGNLEVTRTGSVDIQRVGAYPLFYSCSDKSGNRDTATLMVAVTKRTVFSAEQEAEIDTLDLQRNANHGFTGALKFTAYPSDQYITLVKFDLSKVAKAGLSSARIHFRTFGGGAKWTSTPVPLTFRINLVKSPWVEGTGNWYWADGGWLNAGNILFANYTLSDSIKAKSANSLFSDGIAPVDKAIARAENLVFTASDPVTLTYSDKHGPGAIPKAADLVDLDLDVTAYLKAADSAADFGFLITVEGVPAGRNISFLTKEVGDGSFGPELILSY